MYNTFLEGGGVGLAVDRPSAAHDDANGRSSRKSEDGNDDDSSVVASIVDDSSNFLHKIFTNF